MKKINLPSPLKIAGIFSFLSILVFSGCDGPMGPAGRNGTDGINYTRSVIYDVDPADWGGDENGYTTELDVPEINDDIYYNGAVLVYRLIETEPRSFNLLPYTYVDNLLTIYMDCDIYIGSINLIYKEVYDGANDTFAPEDPMAFKVVIIEGISLSNLKNKVDISDFNAVTKMFNVVERDVNIVK